MCFSKFIFKFRGLRDCKLHTRKFISAISLWRKFWIIISLHAMQFHRKAWSFSSQLHFIKCQIYEMLYVSFNWGNWRSIAPITDDLPSPYRLTEQFNWHYCNYLSVIQSYFIHSASTECVFLNLYLSFEACVTANCTRGSLFQQSVYGESSE